MRIFLVCLLGAVGFCRLHPYPYILQPYRVVKKRHNFVPHVTEKPEPLFRRQAEFARLRMPQQLHVLSLRTARVPERFVVQEYRYPDLREQFSHAKVLGETVIFQPSQFDDHSNKQRNPS